MNREQSAVSSEPHAMNSEQRTDAKIFLVARVCLMLDDEFHQGCLMYNQHQHQAKKFSTTPGGIFPLHPGGIFLLPESPESEGLGV